MAKEGQLPQSARHIPIGMGLSGSADRTCWLHAVSGFQFPLQVSPVVGGVAR